MEARVRPLYWRSPYRQGSWPLIVLKTEAIQQGKHTWLNVFFVLGCWGGVGSDPTWKMCSIGCIFILGCWGGVERQLNMKNMPNWTFFVLECRDGEVGCGVGKRSCRMWHGTCFRVTLLWPFCWRLHSSVLLNHLTLDVIEHPTSCEDGLTLCWVW